MKNIILRTTGIAICLMLTGCSMKETVLEIDGKPAIEKKKSSFDGELIYNNVYKKDKSKIFDIYQKNNKVNNWEEVESYLEYYNSAFTFMFDDKGNLAGFYFDNHYGDIDKAEKEIIKEFKLEESIKLAYEERNFEDNSTEQVISKESGKFTVYIRGYNHSLEPILVTTDKSSGNKILQDAIKKMQTNFDESMKRIGEKNKIAEDLKKQQEEITKEEQETAKKQQTEESIKVNTAKINPEIRIENIVENDGVFNLILMADFTSVDKNTIKNAMINYKVELPLLWEFNESFVVENEGKKVEIKKEVNINKENDTFMVTNNQLEKYVEIIGINNN